MDGNSQRRCIYCLEVKPGAEFNREHVLPQAFGTFNHNLVLTCVCRSCNGYFGRELDERLARDSLEGLARYQSGLKSPHSFPGARRFRSIRARVDEECLARGAEVRHIVDPNDETKLGIELVPQVGFSKSEVGPFEWFPLDAVPSFEQLREKGYLPGTPGAAMQIQGVPVAEALPVLDAKGIPRGKKVTELPPLTGPTRIERMGVLTDPHFRAATKIAVNYLAAIAGAGIALMPEFNEARQYARFGSRPANRMISVGSALEVAKGPTGKAFSAHYIMLGHEDGAVVAQVSLLCQLRYAVVLSPTPFLVPTDLWSGHLFDVEGRDVEEIPRKRLLQAWALGRQPRRKGRGAVTTPQFGGPR